MNLSSLKNKVTLPYEGGGGNEDNTQNKATFKVIQEPSLQVTKVDDL